MSDAVKVRAPVCRVPSLSCVGYFMGCREPTSGRPRALSVFVFGFRYAPSSEIFQRDRSMWPWLGASSTHVTGAACGQLAL